MADAPIAFGPFLFDPARGPLLRDGAPVALGHRGLALLGALVQAEGRVVPKAALMDRAWPGAYVEEGNLTVQIAALRKALGDAPDGQPWIATVPRVGYRLPAAGGAPPREAPPDRPALAVLPFEFLGGDADGDQFAAGVVSDIITALARFRSIAVVSRSSAFAHKGRAADARQVASDLGARYLVEGSVRRAGDRLRITAELIDGVTGAHLWAERFDGALNDQLAFQDSIAESVATVVEPQVLRAESERSRRERPGSSAPYDINLRAFPKVVTEFPQDNAEAYAAVTEALELEPDNALLLAHATWALEHRLTMRWAPIGPDDAQKCVAFARRGLEHAAGDANVMAPCGMALLQVGKDYDLGMAVLRAAAEANPNNLVAITAAGVGALHCGGLDTALDFLHRATRLGPRHPFAHIALCGIAHVNMILGDYAEAVVWADRSRALNPNFDCAHWMLIAANAHLGQMDAAHRFRDDLRRLTPGITIAKIRAGQPARDPSRIAAILEGLRLAGLDED